MIRLAMMIVFGMSVLLAADEGGFAKDREAKERSLASFRSLGDQWMVVLVTGTLARTCFLAGDYSAARGFMREAVKLGRALGNKWAVPYAIEGLADICAKENQAQKAVQLYGAASALREALGLSFSASERTSYQSALDQLHERVADESFNREWERGRSLRLQEAVELAMEAETPKRPAARRKRQAVKEKTETRKVES